MKIPFLDIGKTILDKIFPDAAERQKYQSQLLELYRDGMFGDEERRFAAIVMEAQSDDPWTSRARPSFLYVIYIYLLSALPFGVAYAWDPTIAEAFADGVSAWLESIPGEMWALFGAGYLGYVKKRSDDKKAILGLMQDKSWIQKLAG